MLHTPAFLAYRLLWVWLSLAGRHLWAVWVQTHVVDRCGLFC